jgi:prepilin-type processing-associated H-X9-DG protein
LEQWSRSDCADPGPKPCGGAFVQARALRDADFRDGLSNTVFFSERVVGDGDPNRFDPWRDIFCAQPAVGFCGPQVAIAYCSTWVLPDSLHDSYCGLTWLFGGWQHTWYHHLMPPNSRIPDCNDGCFYVAGGYFGLDTARSEHPGGVNVVHGDGSVRFIAEQINLDVWRAISTRAGSEIAAE